MGSDVLRKVVFGAALQARVDVRLLRVLAAPPDHPVSVYHPEGQYLSGLLLELDPQRAS